MIKAEIETKWTTQPEAELDLEKYCHVDVGGGKIVKYAAIIFIISTKSDVDIDLPGKIYDPDEDHSPKIILDNGIQEWLTENATGKIYFGLTDAWFENDEDAMAFKLRWL